MAFSRRTGWDRRPNPLAERLEALRRTGVPLVDLTESNPTRCELEYPKQLLDALAAPEAMAYEPDPRGLLTAREAICRHLAGQGAQVEPDQVLITASSSEAYAFLFKLLCDPGDEVLLPSPSYPLFDFLTGLESVQPRPYVLSFEGRWRLHASLLAEAAGPRSRAVLSVSPGNPTGSFLHRAELAELAALCAERGWALIVDEVFADYGFGEDPERVGSVAGLELPALTFSLGGLSKSACLPQLKLSWLVASGPKEQVGEAMDRLEVVADTYLSVATPVQHALPGLFSRTAGVREQLKARIAENRALLEKARPPGASWSVQESEGGWYAVLRIPAEPGEEKVCLALLDRGVVVHPGFFYDFPRGAHLVVSLIPPPAAFARGASLLAGVLSGPVPG
ncbi:MAG: pyridoxal phosphate-dependent aminotransferase [Myxococcales bacterium]|nr:pyridoxal phosphate-dependent aminotransferase [Myxococcales bacterium]